MSSIKSSKDKTNLSQNIFFVVCLVAFFLVLIYIPRLSIPMALSYILSLIVRPILPILHRLGINRQFSIIIIFICFILFFIYPAVKVIPVLEEEMSKVQTYFPKLEIQLSEKILYFKNQLEGKTGFVINDQHIVTFLDNLKNSSQKILYEIPLLVTSFLEWILLIPLFLYFLLLEGKGFKKKFLIILPNKYFERIYFIVHQFDKKIGGYIFAKFLEANLVGLIIGFGLFFVGFPFASLLGFFAGVSNIIPYLGPIIGVLPTLGILLVAPEYTHLTGGVLVLYLIANLIDMVVIFPILVSRIVNLHPLIVIISVIIGSQFWGVLGMVISVPLANIIKLLIGEIYRELFPQYLKNE